MSEMIVVGATGTGPGLAAVEQRELLRADDRGSGVGAAGVGEGTRGPGREVLFGGSLYKTPGDI